MAECLLRLSLGVEQLTSWPGLSLRLLASSSITLQHVDVWSLNVLWSVRTRLHSIVSCVRWRTGMEQFLNPSRLPGTSFGPIHASGQTKLHAGNVYNFGPVPPSQKPIFDIPFDRDDDFVGREDDLSFISDHFSKNGRVALWGIGGVG